MELEEETIETKVGRTAKENQQSTPQGILSSGQHLRTPGLQNSVESKRTAASTSEPGLSVTEKTPRAVTKECSVTKKEVRREK